MRPDRRVRRVPADDQPSPQGPARGRAAHLRTTRDLGVLPGATRCPRDLGAAAPSVHRRRRPARSGAGVSPPTTAALWRRLVAESIGSGLLVTVVVGSGIAASRLSPHDVGLQLLENALTTALGLAVLILAFGPVSGAHFNPVISAADWWVGRRTGTGLRADEMGAYALAQAGGAISGAVLADVMFAAPAVAWSHT